MTSSEREIADICGKYLLRDLRSREDPVWFDYVNDRLVGQLHRIGTYLAALFVLSNVNRYEPELLDNASSARSDLGFFLSTFLDAAERFLPQLVLEVVEGPMYFV